MLNRCLRTLLLSGSLTLVPDEDPRPGINKAVQHFSNISINPPTIKGD